MSQGCEKPVIWLHRGVCDPLGMEGRGGADPMPLLWTKKKLCGHVDGSRGTIKGSGGIPWGVKIKQEEEDCVVVVLLFGQDLSVIVLDMVCLIVSLVSLSACHPLLLFVHGRGVAQ